MEVAREPLRWPQPDEAYGVRAITSQVWAELGAHALLYEPNLAADSPSRIDAGATMAGSLSVRLAAGLMPIPVFDGDTAQAASPSSGPYEAGEGEFSAEASAAAEAGQADQGDMGGMDGGAAGAEGAGGGMDGGGGESGAE